jgi:hypothetical protein
MNDINKLNQKHIYEESVGVYWEPASQCMRRYFVTINQGFLCDQEVVKGLCKTIVEYMEKVEGVRNFDSDPILPSNLEKAYQDFNGTGSDIHRRNGGEGYSAALRTSASAFDVTSHELAEYVAFKWGAQS